MKSQVQIAAGHFVRSKRLKLNEQKQLQFPPPNPFLNLKFLHANEKKIKDDV